MILVNYKRITYNSWKRRVYCMNSSSSLIKKMVSGCRCLEFIHDQFCVLILAPLFWKCVRAAIIWRSPYLEYSLVLCLDGSSVSCSEMRSERVLMLGCSAFGTRSFQVADIWPSEGCGGWCFCGESSAKKKRPRIWPQTSRWHLGFLQLADPSLPCIFS